MKLFLSFAIGLLLASSALAQSPNKFNYQAVARDLSGNVLSNQDVSVRIAILEGSASGSEIFAETHDVTTNGFGLFNFQIGSGTSILGDLSLIDWGANSYFMHVAFDGSGGTNYTDLSTTELVSVPYAMFANSVLNDSVADDDADPTNEIQVIGLNGDSLTLSNGGSVYLGGYVNPVLYDNDSLNEIQILAFNNDTLYLSDGGNAYLGAYANPTLYDNDSTNEIQSVSFNNDTLYLSDGGNAYLGAYANPTLYDNDSTNEIQSVSFNNDTLYLSDGGSAYLGAYTNPELLDNDSTNELQVINLSNDTLFLSNGGYVSLSSYVNQANFDNDSLNEIQTLSLSNDTLYLSEGGSVALGSTAPLWNDSTSNLNTTKTVGIGTTTPDTNASLELQYKPFLPPRLRTEEIAQLNDNVTGMMVFNTDNNCPYYFGADSWEPACMLGGVSISPGVYSLVSVPSAPFSGSAAVEHIDVDDNKNYAILGVMSGTLNIKGTPVPTNGGAGSMLIYLTDEDELEWYKDIPQGYGSGEHFMQMDSDGNVYVAGTFTSTYTIDSTTITSAGGLDIFMAKFNSSGNLVFLNAYGGANNEILYNMSVGPNDNLYLCGLYTLNTSIGSWYHAASGGSGNDGLFFKTNSSGAVQWSHSTGGNYPYDVISTITADSNENVYIVFNGNNSGTVFLNGSFYTAPQGYIAKMNAAATSVSWLHSTSALPSSSMAVASLDGSNLFVAFTRTSSTTFQVGSYSESVSGSSSSPRGYIIALDGSDGTHDWSKSFSRGRIHDIKVTESSMWVSGRIKEGSYFSYEGTVLNYLNQEATFFSELSISGVHEKSIYATTNGSSIIPSTVGLNQVGNAFMGVYGIGEMNVNGQLTPYSSGPFPAILKEVE